MFCFNATSTTEIYTYGHPLSLPDALPFLSPLEPLGGELDRGERVLDLMCDTARDIRPGGPALVEQLLGNVVEGEPLPRGIARDLDRERPRLAFGAALDPRLARVAFEQSIPFSRKHGERPADGVAPTRHDQSPRHALDETA